MHKWHPVIGFDGLYECNKNGEFRRVTKARGTRPGKLLKPCKSGQYLRVDLRKDGQYHKIYAHRLIAETFLGRSMLPVNHKNGDKFDNRLCNLEFVTQQQNLLHATRVLGVRRGANHWNARLTESDVAEIYRMREAGALQRQIAERFNIKRATVAGILTKRQWSYFNA